MPDNRSAARVAVHCEAVKVSYRQTKDGMVVSFAIHPNDMPSELALAPVGTRVMLAIAAIGDDEQPVPVAVAKPRDPSKSERAKAEYAGKDKMAQAVTRCSMLSKDAAFHRFTGVAFVEQVVPWLYETLGISSRREIGTDERAYRAFLDLEHQFAIYQGREPEPR